MQNFYNDECELCVVYGMPEGVGKTGYVTHVQADVLGYRKASRSMSDWIWKYKDAKDRDVPKWESDYESVKPLIKYYPKDVVLSCKNMLLKGERLECMLWDDAGTWLNAMEYNNPFVVAFMEYVSLARSNWAMIILTTPVEEWILKKLKTARGLLHCEIFKTAGFSHKSRPRMARGYKIVKYKNRVRPYFQTEWEDSFEAMMPDDFYKWYKPLRDSYARVAADKMERAISKRRAKGVHTEFDESVLESVKENIAEANDESKDFSEVIDQLKVEVM